MCKGDVCSDGTACRRLPFLLLQSLLSTTRAWRRHEQQGCSCEQPERHERQPPGPTIYLLHHALLSSARAAFGPPCVQLPALPHSSTGGRVRVDAPPCRQSERVQFAAQATGWQIHLAVAVCVVCFLPSFPSLVTGVLASRFSQPFETGSELRASGRSAPETKADWLPATAASQWGNTIV